MDAYNCLNCEEQDVTQVTCPICDKHYCEICEEEESADFKSCHICNKRVCVNCYTDHKVNGVRTCDVCFDKLVVTSHNYRILTKTINEALNDATDAMNEDMDAFGLGAICGQLRTLKNRFGF